MHWSALTTTGRIKRKKMKVIQRREGKVRGKKRSSEDTHIKTKLWYKTCIYYQQLLAQEHRYIIFLFFHFFASVQQKYAKDKINFMS